MPTRPLNPSQESLKSLTDWLNENLNDHNSIVPHIESLEKVKENKGIYFWFMHPDAYRVLSNFITITPITNPVPFIKEINGVLYPLVYIGTAGTGKNGKSNLQERMCWHINQEHTKSNICHGTLSTLRLTLGALLSNDLILTNTEEIINSFMRSHMKVYWIEYPIDFDLINNDEIILINKLRPLLNLKNNPNAKANAAVNSTQLIKKRRILVYKNTRLRLGCFELIESEEVQKNIPNPSPDNPSYNFQIISEDNECIEIVIENNQSVLNVIRGITGLPLGHCTFSIIDSITGINLFPTWKETGRNINLNPEAQNIYTYFANQSKHRIARWREIQEIMNHENIEEITIKICRK